MEGETDDCLTLQAELLPTGSVSFGRFELETLSWERRSSFSHNRYLEEVEKYSTPGSVTQKKAYFEAHFKKKALLLHQASSETHNGSDSHNSENDIEDHANNMEESTGHGGNKRQETFVWNNETRGSVNVQEPDVMESTEGLQFSWYDESPPDASDEDEFDVTECKVQIQFAHYAEEQEASDEHQDDVIDFKQEINNSPSALPTKSMPCPVELVEKGEVVQSQYGNTRIESKKDDLHEVMGEPKTENGSVDADEDDLPEKCVSPHSSLAEKDIQPSLKRTQKGSRSVRETVEQKSLKEKLRSTIVVAQSTRKTANEKNSLSSVKTFSRTLKKTERALGTKTEKRAFINVPSSTCSDTKVSNPKVSEKAQARQGIISEKGLGEKKGGSCIQSISRDGENIVRQPAERPKKVVCSTMANANQINAAFKFRSDERAEKRKEYFVRLKEKLHAKEAQINEIQARTQVQTEAEMKQLRRSLNFKATPMPSFYHEAAPRVSDGRKMVPRQPTVKSTSPGDRTAADQANFEAIVGLVSSEPAGSSNVPLDSKHEPSTASDSLSRSVKKNGSDRRAERGRVVVQKQQAERKVKKEVRVSSSSSIRVTRVGVSKEMQDALDGSLAVDVAS